MNKLGSILVVDDDDVIRQLFVTCLSQEGYAVEEAATGLAGLALAQAHRPDLLLLDVRLPDISGIEVCRIIKTDPAMKDVFIVLCSGEATSVKNKVDGLHTGADEYLIKPFGVNELLARVQTLMRLRNTTAALRVSEEHHRRLIDILPDAVCLIHPRGELLAVNSQAVTMFGCASTEELLHQNLFDFIPPAERARGEADIMQALKTGIIRNAEYTMRRKTGELFNVEMSATVSLGIYGQPTGLLSVVRDVTERKQAWDALGESEARKSAIMAAALDGIITIDHEGRMIEVNSAAEKIFGRRQSRLLHENVSEVIPPPFRAWFQRGLASCFTGEKGPVQGSRIEMTALRADGGEFPAEFAITRIKLAGPPMFTLHIRDITQTKRAEDELRALPQHIIKAQETERSRLARELHDGINQMIASVKMRLSKVESSLPELKPAAREILARCNRLLVKVLEENRRIAHNLRPTDLDNLGLADACNSFCSEVQSRTGLQVHCRVNLSSRRLPPALELHLFRILQEAVNNIEKHAQAKTIKLQIKQADGVVVLKVQDDGCGFDLKNAAARQQGWHGLGLTNMRERALALGGACEIESAPGKGTILTVRVPLPAASAASDRPAN